MVSGTSAAPAQRPALGIPGVMWRVRAIVYGVVYVLALAAEGATDGSRLSLTLFMLGAVLAPLLIWPARPEWALEASAGVDLLVGFVLWWQLPAMPGAGLAMTMWAVVLIAVASRHHIEDLLLPVAIALEVLKLLVVLFGPDRPVGAGLGQMFRSPFDEIVFALAQTCLVLGVYFATRALVGSQRTRRGAAVGESRYEAIVVSSPVATLVVVSGTVVFCNPAAERLLGVAHEEVVGSDLLTLVPEEVVPGTRNAIQRAVGTGETVAVSGEPLIVANGTNLHIMLQIAPMTYAGESAVQIVVSDHYGDPGKADTSRVSEDRYRSSGT